MAPFSKTDCSHKYGLYAPTSSRVTTETSYRVGLRLMRADTRTCCMSIVIFICDAADDRGLTSINVCKKWLLMHAGLNGVLSASKNTTQTISLPIWRLRCNFCGSCFSYGSNVDTWNIISMFRQFVYTEYSPEKWNGDTYTHTHTHTHKEHKQKHSTMSIGRNMQFDDNNNKINGNEEKTKIKNQKSPNWFSDERKRSNERIHKNKRNDK